LSPELLQHVKQKEENPVASASDIIRTLVSRQSSENEKEIGEVGSFQAGSIVASPRHLNFGKGRPSLLRDLTSKNF
jgi:hypothetical protein